MTPRRPLRVCHVVYSFYENDNRVMRYAETLTARGDTVDVIALRRVGQAARASLNGVNISRVQRRVVSERAQWTYLSKTLFFFVRCLCLLSVRGLGKAYDVVHVHNMPDFLVFAAIVPKLRGARVILDLHDLVPELYVGKFQVPSKSCRFRALLFAERQSCQFADHVIVANHLWHETVTGRSVHDRKCTPIVNYPDLALFRPLPSGRSDGRDRFVFLYPGTLNHHQGLDIAVAAFAEASPLMPTAELRILGDGPARESLRRQIAALGLGARITITDRVPLQEVPRLMASVDAGVVPKRADGFGNEAFSTKILEFMACGVPVIVSRTKVDAYYFTDDVVRFFSPGDVADLARAMAWVYAHADDRQKLAQSALQFAAHHGWNAFASTYLDTGRSCGREFGFERTPPVTATGSPLARFLHHARRSVSPPG